ncbi:MAG: STAS domain-containing protein [Limnospira sp.]
MNVSECCVIRPQNRLDSRGGQDLKQQISAIAHPKSALWIIDMSEVEFIDSSGLGALIVAQKIARQQGCQIILCHLSGATRMIFEITQLDRVFKIVDQSDPMLSDSQPLLSA